MCCCCWSLTAQAQVYKWTDSDGKIITAISPCGGSTRAQTLDIPSQPTPEGGVNNVRLWNGLNRNCAELRATSRGVPVGELDRPASRKKTAKLNSLFALVMRIEPELTVPTATFGACPSSTIGNASSRAREIHAAKDELRQIYRNYGIKAPEWRCRYPDFAAGDRRPAGAGGAGDLGWVIASDRWGFKQE
ncbi:MAG: DUF4124 domain-containing protein [Candidatus Competibacteraceae bacterium]|nr:DUF4124 domain-containing protein [Candidatus Competibacteraceae bacterium]